MAVGAFARHIAVGQELVSLLVVELRGGFLRQFPFVVEFAEEISSKLVVDFTGGAAVDIEVDAELLKRIFNHLVVAVNHILRGNALLTGADGNGYTVLIAASDENHVLFLQTEIAHVDVCRHIDTG